MVAEVSNNISKFTKSVVGRIEDRKALEGRAKIFLKSRVMIKPELLRVTFTLQDINGDIPLANYIFNEGYSLEKGFTAKEFHYELTPYGRRWALE
jgi:hypothetical protein